MEENESPVDGVKREVFEETGYMVEIDGLISTYAEPDKNELVLLFRAT